MRFELLLAIQGSGKVSISSPMNTVHVLFSLVHRWGGTAVLWAAPPSTALPPVRTAGKDPWTVGTTSVRMMTSQSFVIRLCINFISYLFFCTGLHD